MRLSTTRERSHGPRPGLHRVTRVCLGLFVVVLALLSACQGPPGPVGLQGPPAPTGVPGLQGEEGLQGTQGAQGSAGPEGPRGLQGSQGQPGLEGPQAAPGPRGDTGPQGSQGPPGPESPQAASGPKGDTGPQGSEGPQGEAGPSGPAGDPGLPGLAGPTGSPGPSIADHLIDLRDAIVFLDLGSMQGSGVRISPNEILTAQHVVGTRATASVSIRGEGPVLATVVGYDVQRDVALLTFQNTSDGTTAPIPQSNVVTDGTAVHEVERVGDDVAAVAYVPGISRTTPIATFGRIGVLWNLVPGQILQGQIDNALTNGMSGGGIFNRYGEFLGIILSKTVDFDGNGRYLSFREINEVIEDLRAGTKR